MSFRRVGWLAAVALATWLELSCGQVYRPVVIPTGTTPPNPANFHAVFGVTTNVPFNPGSALQIDVSGDTNIGEADMGVNPTHAAILPNNSRIFVASAGSLYTGDADVVTSFFPATDSRTTTGLGTVNTFTLPNVGPTQLSGILSISESGTTVTMTLSAPLINAQVGALIVVSGVVQGGANALNPTGYDGSFPITSVNGTTIQYTDSIANLAASSGGTATVPIPLFCRYLPDFVATSEASTVFVANFGDENGATCNLPSTDSVAALNTATNSISNIMYLAPASHPIAMVETPDSQNLYVLNEGKDTLGNNNVLNLSPIDLSTVATIPVGNTAGSVPVWAVARADSRRVYVLTQGDIPSSESGNLIPIDPATNTVLASQTNLSVGPGANFVLYDPHLNRLYVTNPNTSTFYVFSATGGVDPTTLAANDTPTLMATICMNTGLSSSSACPAGSTPVSVCATACSPVSVAALQDGSRFYVASFQTQTNCTDPNVGASGSCIVPMLTVFDALSITVKPAASTLLAPNPSLSLLTSPQFATTQYAVPPVASCVPAAAYTPGSTRFRMFAAPAADSSHVYVSICDAGSIADISTVSTTVSSQPNNTPDQLVANIPPQFGACGSRSCSAVASITAFSITNNIVTFTAVNSFIPGQKLSITGMTSSTGTLLNGSTLTVLNTGLSAAQFQAVFTCSIANLSSCTTANVSNTSDTGSAVPLPPPQNPIFLLTGQ